MTSFLIALVAFFPTAAQAAPSPKHVYVCRDYCDGVSKYVAAIDPATHEASLWMFHDRPMCNLRESTPVRTDHIAVCFTPTRRMSYVWQVRGGNEVGTVLYTQLFCLPRGALNGQPSFSLDELDQVRYNHPGSCSFISCKLEKLETEADYEAALESVSARGCLSHSPAEIPAHP